MKAFMDENFVLHNATAEHLYHQYAKDLPIIDYHCHLSPQEIYENTQFENITQVWLYGDHYKWRAMRANGVEEKYVTGDASDYDKFLAWARTVPQLIGNPLYHWTHLELKRYFGVEESLNESTAPSIWKKVNEQLTSGDWNVRDFIVNSGVEVVCTTDDPTDSLAYHQKIADDPSFQVKVLPSYRPDKGLEINQDGFQDWVKELEEAADLSITQFTDLLQALQQRIDFFHEHGGRVSDHALNTVVYEEATEEEVAVIFAKAWNGEKVSEQEEKQYKSYLLTFLGKAYHEKGWVMQYHMNAHRNNNQRMFEKIGPDTGFDSMNDQLLAQPLVRLLDSLERSDSLPKTILYSLNPRDNVTIATIIGSFQGGGIPGKIQLGTAWWFNDTRLGMINQMETLADIGVFSQFVGMLTDSRSFLSYTRHEYFRRIMCNLVGEWVENGEYPNDEETLAKIVRDISYYNAKEYFPF
ncbi:glucuronate isomerase [Gracilibacillus phocaeensis]|uniref:glucuronate isomerase n=1 Tax=Gracilibacillus phocaeensis TaxID=2042304 RepID=UPI0010301B6D|nr:glucuronate isomerase [Gracilibacillus phocaeensis]